MNVPSSPSSPLLTIVVPVYRNRATLPALLDVLAGIAQRIPCEFVFVVDGSPDTSFEFLREELPRRPFASQLLLLSRNFGSFAAIAAGMAAGRGELFSFLAADLQEPPELVLESYRLLASGEKDIVFGNRIGREDSVSSRLFSAGFWWLYRRLVNRDIPPGGVDIFSCTRAVRDAVLQLQEQGSSLVGLLFWVGFRRGFVDYARRRRTEGKSGWSFSKRLNYFLDSFFSFTSLPIKCLTGLGVLGILASVGFGAVVLFARLSGYITVPGYSATILTVIFFGGLNSLGLGIIGEYVWRGFRNTQRRPAYIVSCRLAGDGRPPS